jgi:hypothetical protein
MRGGQIGGAIIILCACIMVVLACDGSGGANLLRAGLFPNVPFNPGLEGGGNQGGGGAIGDDDDSGGGQDGGEDEDDMLAMEGTMTVTFINNSTENAQVALWASEDLGASTELVQVDGNLVTLGPEGAESFVPVLDPGDQILTTLNCVDARSISAAVAENLVLITPQSCISPPLRQGTDFDCDETTVINFIVLIRDGPGGVLEIVAGSQIYQGCSS